MILVFENTVFALWGILGFFIFEAILGGYLMVRDLFHYNRIADRKNSVVSYIALFAG